MTPSGTADIGTTAVKGGGGGADSNMTSQPLLSLLSSGTKE